MGFIRQSSEGADGDDYHIGQRGLFQVDQKKEGGETTLIVRSIDPHAGSSSSQHPTDPSHSVRSQRPSSPHASSDMHPTMDEQQIKDWLRRVEKSLTTLRRNRAKRLNEEFYSGS